MDPSETLAIRFHFGGEFYNDGTDVHYIGGKEEMSYIDRDKISLPEVIGHLRDHCEYNPGMQLHWLFPGRELNNGTKQLIGDALCQYMADYITDAGVADIYVQAEPLSDDEEKEDESDFEDEIVSAHEEDEADEAALVQVPLVGSSAAPREVTVITSSPEKMQKEIDCLRKIYLSQSSDPSSSNKKKLVLASENDEVQNVSEADEESSSDEEYQPEEVNFSEEDEEAVNIRKQYREFKRKKKAGQAVDLDDILFDGHAFQPRKEDIYLGMSDEVNSTEYNNSSNEDESFDEEDGHIFRRSQSYAKFDSKMPVPSFSVGMRFRGKRQFKKAIIKYGLAQKRCIKFVKDEADRVRAKCTWPTCPWVILLSTTTRSNSWQVSSFTDGHQCPPTRKNKLVTARRIAEKYEKMIRANPTWPLESLRATVQEEMLADVHISKCKRAKAIVMEKMLDATKGEYSRVFDYQEELIRSNPGSTIIVKLDPDERKPVFLRFYVCFAACKRGFMSGCRKVVGLDGCFFKGATSGELLCALGRDSNNQMYPIAWAVVEKETNNSWDWFCSLLFRDIDMGSGDGWVIISDQQKGIITAVETWAPNVEHRMCARHIYANWRKTYKDKDWQKKFWRCAKAPCRMLFNYHRAKLAQVTREGARAILKTDPEHWSRAYFKLGSNCDSVDNNICESFNKWIVGARYLPIISMLESIRRKVMVRIQEMRTKSARWNQTVCPNIYKKINASIHESGRCHVIWNGKDGYEVKHEDRGFTVSLEKKACSCRYWQLSGLPCAHALSCIYYSGRLLDEFIAKCYYVTEFKKIYDHCMEPIEGMSSWPKSRRPNPEAPKYVKMPGRPKKNRTREPHEKPKSTKVVSRVGTTIRCRRCKCIGHNRKTCEKRNPSSTGGSANTEASSAPQVGSSTTQAKKRALSDVSGSKSTKRMKASEPPVQHSISNATASATISTRRGRSTANATAHATANASTQVLPSQASSNVTVQVNSGGASVTASASVKEHANIHPTPRARKLPLLLMQDD